MDFKQIFKISSPYTITSFERMRKLYESVIYLNENNIDGSFVECGVYKGGSIMNMALTQQNFQRLVHIYLYDTFTGMTPQGEHDINYRGVPASTILKNPNKLCVSSIEEVKENLKKTGYPQEFFHFRKGDVAHTLTNEKIPKKISLLRIDTDWHESTKISLEALYPNLVQGGVLILDDYGYWKGARKAVDDYFALAGDKPEFIPIDKGVGAVYLIK